jgi:hypothetical protein
MAGAAAGSGPDYAARLRAAGWSVSTSPWPGQCSVVDNDGACRRDGPHVLGYVPAPGQACLTVLRACDFHRRALITPLPVWTLTCGDSRTALITRVSTWTALSLQVRSIVRGGIYRHGGKLPKKISPLLGMLF